MHRSMLFILLILFTMNTYSDSPGMGSPVQNIESDNLTDQQRHQSQQFFHSQKAQRVLNEGCTGMFLNEEQKKLFKENPDKAREQFGEDIAKGEAVCNGQDDIGDTAFGMDPQTVKMISQMYAMVIGMGGLGSEMGMRSKSEQAAKDAGSDAGEKATETKSEKRDAADYCRYIAVGTETIAMFQQQMAQDEITKNFKDQAAQQKETIMKVARSHQERSKNAKYQAVGWGLTTACYTTKMVTSMAGGAGYAVNPAGDNKMGAVSNWLKLGASAFFTYYFKKDIDRHKGHYESMKKIADSLPKKGDCNPITDKNCYCSEETTMYDASVCAPYLGARSDGNKTVIEVTCMDNELKADPTCQCKETSSCFSEEYQTIVTDNSGNIREGISPAHLRDLKRHATGQIPRNVANHSGTNRAIAQLKRAAKELEKLPISNQFLNKDQKKKVELLEEAGIPKGYAKALVLTPMSKKQMAAAEKFKNRKFAAIAGKAKSNSKNRALYFKDPKKTSYRKSKSGDQDYYKNLMNKLKGKGKNKDRGGKIVRFSDRAMRNAQINRNNRKNLFSIISYRYLSSGLKRLKVLK